MYDWLGKLEATEEEVVFLTIADSIYRPVKPKTKNHQLKR
jgi:hypothetical protein